jgi:hypothetical protein
MTRDYASRSATRAPKRRGGKARSAPRRKTSARHSASQPRAIWSAPSFSAGAIFGAALVLLLSQAPALFEDTVNVARGGPVTEPDAIEFEFPELLENGTVEVEPNAYEAHFPGENPDDPGPEYQIQAISVKTADEAGRITRELLAMGLPARSERVELSSGLWYRIMVGPYNSKREAERVINRLAERNMVPEIRTRS